MFLISDNYVYIRVFDAEDIGKDGWRNSNIRTWLNNEFINSAFNASERKRIIMTDLDDVSTKDKIFLLNVDEAKRYFKSNDDRKLKNSGNNDWVLRGFFERISCLNKYAYVSGYGDINEDHKGGERFFSSKKFCIRPGMWVSL